MLLYCEFHDQHSILSQQSNQHYHRYLCIDIVFQPQQFQQEECSKYTGSERKNYYKRENKAFVLRGQDQVYKTQTDQEDVNGFIATRYFIFGDTSPVDTKASWQCFIRHLFDHLQSLSTTITRRSRAAYLRRIVHVVPRDLRQTIYFFHFH